VIDDTHALGTGPFELLIGREFKLDIWEKLIKEMLIGEIARFSCPYKMISEYPTISQALRKLSKQKHACNHDDDGHDHTHQCGYSALMYGTGHRDLDEITNNKTPLAFEIELLKVEGPEDYKKESWAMTDDEKYQLIPRLKEEGNQFYKSGLITEASDKYSEALGYLESFSIREKPGSGQWNKIESDKIPLLLNYSQCQLMLGNYFDVIRYTGQVLEFDPNNVKALYRRGRAYSATWNNEEAERDFMKALGLDESLKKSVDKELTILKDKMKLKNKEDRLKLQGKLFI
jgi:AH receptor-interacting protein